jgi:hypothetical protein
MTRQDESKLPDLFPKKDFETCRNFGTSKKKKREGDAPKKKSLRDVSFFVFFFQKSYVTNFSKKFVFDEQQRYSRNSKESSRARLR